MNLCYLKKVICSIRDILFCVAFLYIAEIFGMMAGSLVYQILPQEDISPYIYIIISTIAYIMLICTGMKLYEKNVLHLSAQKLCLSSLNSLRNTMPLAVAELTYIILTILLVVLVCPGRWEPLPADQRAFNLFRAFLDFGIGAGVAEEMVFRGTMFTALKKQFGNGVSIFGTSLIFSLLHITNAETAWSFFVTLSFTMALGIILCLIRHRTGTLLTPIVFHALWNIIFFGVVNTGTEKNPYTLITYVTKSPLADFIPLITIPLLLYTITKTELRKTTLDP